MHTPFNSPLTPEMINIVIVMVNTFILSSYTAMQHFITHTHRSLSMSWWNTRHVLNFDTYLLTRRWTDRRKECMLTGWYEFIRSLSNHSYRCAGFFKYTTQHMGPTACTVPSEGRSDYHDRCMTRPGLEPTGWQHRNLTSGTLDCMLSYTNGLYVITSSSVT